MSLIPEFGLGSWNAWIFVIFNLRLYVFPGYLINKEAMDKFYTFPEFTGKTKVLARILQSIYPILFIHSFFLPIKLDTAWFYVGLLIFIFAWVWSFWTHVSFAITPLSEPVIKGTYRFSRNPTYFGQFLLFVGIGLASASWVVLLCAVIYVSIANYLLSYEERFCLDKYGNSYQECARTLLEPLTSSTFMVVCEYFAFLRG